MIHSPESATGLNEKLKRLITEYVTNIPLGGFNSINRPGETEQRERVALV